MHGGSVWQLGTTTSTYQEISQTVVITSMLGGSSASASSAAAAAERPETSGSAGSAAQSRCPASRRLRPNSASVASSTQSLPRRPSGRWQYRATSARSCAAVRGACFQLAWVAMLWNASAAHALQRQVAVPLLCRILEFGRACNNVEAKHADLRGVVLPALVRVGAFLAHPQPQQMCVKAQSNNLRGLRCQPKKWRKYPSQGNSDWCTSSQGPCTAKRWTMMRGAGLPATGKD